MFNRRGNGRGRKLRKSLEHDMRALNDLAAGSAGADADGSFDLHGFALRAFHAAPTRDIEYLIEHGCDGHQFYARELAPNWRGLTREQRTRKIASFVRFGNLLDHAPGDGDGSGPVTELCATVHTKIALLASAYDAQYGDSYRRRIARNPAQFGEYELSDKVAQH
jgi:hypothetical protein